MRPGPRLHIRDSPEHRWRLAAAKADVPSLVDPGTDELAQAGGLVRHCREILGQTSAPIPDVRRLAGTDWSPRWAGRGAATSGEASTMTRAS
jgi:hypothetical protein